MNKLKIWLALPLIVFSLMSCAKAVDPGIQLVDAKMAMGVDEKYKPVNPVDVFPSGTTNVYCWFAWRDARKDASLLARWHYVTDDVPVLDYNFTIPRKEGSGSVSLSMPQGKVLPSGLYRVNLEAGGRSLKSIIFKVL